MASITAQSTPADADQAHWAVRLLLLLFVLICLFDPANTVLGGKVLVFVALWPAAFLSLGRGRGDANLPNGLLLYGVAFIAIPLLSILWYYLRNGQEPFEGFQLLKGYLLVSLALILFITRIDLMPQLAAALTLLAILVIGLFVYLQVYPEQFDYLHRIGIGTGIVSLDKRPYGPDLTLIQVYFVTSSMLAFSIAYYFDRAMSVQGRRAKLARWILVLINLSGMLLAGTRNNILVSILMPFLLWPLYTRRVLLNANVSLLLLVLLALPFLDELQAFFDATETGNRIRLALLEDYVELFSDPVTLLFGQGLGAWQYWGARGGEFYVTELTYLEIVRNFGLIGGAVMSALLLFPVVHAFVPSASRRERALAVAYFFYLLMCISSPNLFSSTGMLGLAVVVANIALDRSRDKARSLS